MLKKKKDKTKSLFPSFDKPRIFQLEQCIIAQLLISY